MDVDKIYYNNCYRNVKKMLWLGRQINILHIGWISAKEVYLTLPSIEYFNCYVVEETLHIELIGKCKYKRQLQTYTKYTHRKKKRPINIYEFPNHVFSVILTRYMFSWTRIGCML